MFAGISNSGDVELRIQLLTELLTGGQLARKQTALWKQQGLFASRTSGWAVRRWNYV
jgi:hypothetical protein